MHYLGLIKMLELKFQQNKAIWTTEEAEENVNFHSEVIRKLLRGYFLAQGKDYSKDYEGFIFDLCEISLMMDENPINQDVAAAVYSLLFGFTIG